VSGERWPARAPVATALAMLVAGILLAPALARGDLPPAAREAQPPAAHAVPPPALSVRTAGLIDASTGQRLYGVAGDASVPIASTTKIMTALVTLEHVRHLGTIFTQNDWRAAPGDSQIGLAPGERMTVHDLLLALLLPSADDAAENLAFNIGHGSVARFVAMMNREAIRLGLTHTHFSTPVGFDVPGNYSSAFDLDKLAAYVLSHSPLFRRIVAQSRATLQTGPEHYVINRNDLVGRVPWINGVKSGHTGGAGYTLVASGTRNGMTLIGAVLGAASQSARDLNALALLDFGFAEFRLVKPVLEGRVLARPAVSNLPGASAALVAGASFERVVRRTDRVGVRIVIEKQIAGPMPARTVAGRALVTVGRRIVARVPLLLARALPAPPPPTTTPTTTTTTAPATTTTGGLAGGGPLALLGGGLLAALGLWLRRHPRVRLTRHDHLEGR